MQLEIWWLPLIVLGVIFALRLILAPYWMYKDKLAENDTIKREKQELEERLEDSKRQYFSMNWKNYEWHLRREGWDSPQWKDDGEGHSLLLKGWVWINTVDTAHIESVALHLGGQDFSCVWGSRNFYGSEECQVVCDIPLSMNRDEKTAYLVAIVNGDTYRSKPFTLELPQVKPIPDKEGSQKQ